MDYSRLTYGQLWAIAFTGSCLLWFFGVSFVRILPAPLQLLFMLLPVIGFAYSVWLIPHWQRQGTKTAFVESLAERRMVQALTTQYQFDLASINLEHESRMRELASLYQPEPSQATEAQVPIPLEDKARAIAGDYGQKLTLYLLTKAPVDEDGWMSVEKLRANWAKNNGLTKAQLLELLGILTQNDLGEFKDMNCTEWRIQV